MYIQKKINNKNFNLQFKVDNNEKWNIKLSFPKRTAQIQKHKNISEKNLLVWIG